MSDFTSQARATAHALRALFPETPLQRNEHLSARYDADIWLKREDLSPVRSYKLRGAYTALRKHLAHHPDQTRFVCASAGNHAQGVAYACRHFSVQGTVFMPVTTPQQNRSAEISLAQANADQKIVESKRAVEIETLNALGEVEPLNALAEQLAMLQSSGPDVLQTYVRNVRLKLFGQAQRDIMEVKS